VARRRSQRRARLEARYVRESQADHGRLGGSRERIAEHRHAPVEDLWRESRLTRREPAADPLGL